MNKLFTIIVLIIFCPSLFGQTQKDSIVVKFIHEKKDFVAFVDAVNLPNKVMPYYQNMLSYMESNKMNKYDYYVSINSITEEDSLILFPIYHYNGFKKLKELEIENEEANKNRKEGEPMILITITGNASGEDGYLEVNRFTKKVVKFSVWQ